MLLFSRTLSRSRIFFQSESRTASEIFSKLFRSVFRHELQCHENTRKNNVVLYSYEITDRVIIDEVFRKYHIDESERAINSEIIATNSLGVFTAGVFLACGSVNDPSKEYHLEFTVPEAKLAAKLSELLSDIGVTSGTVLRRGQYIVYIKDSESIEDTLTFIGAQQCTIELMNVKIYKDVRNKANRIANCDAANIDKVINAAMKQIDDIKLIDGVCGLDSLSDDLREIAFLRLENTEMSLQEIGESLSEPISRSGVSHRFKRISKIADELRAGSIKHES